MKVLWLTLLFFLIGCHSQNHEVWPDKYRDISIPSSKDKQWVKIVPIQGGLYLLGYGDQIFISRKDILFGSEDPDAPSSARIQGFWAKLVEKQWDFSKPAFQWPNSDPLSQESKIYVIQNQYWVLESAQTIGVFDSEGKPLWLLNNVERQRKLFGLTGKNLYTLRQALRGPIEIESYDLRTGERTSHQVIRHLKGIDSAILSMDHQHLIFESRARGRSPDDPGQILWLPLRVEPIPKGLREIELKPKAKAQWKGRLWPAVQSELETPFEYPKASVISIIPPQKPSEWILRSAYDGRVLWQGALPYALRTMRRLSANNTWFIEEDGLNQHILHAYVLEGETLRESWKWALPQGEEMREIIQSQGYWMIETQSTEDQGRHAYVVDAEGWTVWKALPLDGEVIDQVIWDYQWAQLYRKEGQLYLRIHDLPKD